jgi:thiamine biosynthesis protein ThiS
MNGTCAIIVNGKNENIPAGTTVSGYLTRKDFAERRVVIELNKVILERNVWKTHVLNNNDSLEIVCFVGGG